MPKVKFVTDERKNEVMNRLVQQFLETEPEKKKASRETCSFLQSVKEVSEEEEIENGGTLANLRRYSRNTPSIKGLYYSFQQPTNPTLGCVGHTKCVSKWIPPKRIVETDKVSMPKLAEEIKEKVASPYQERGNGTIPKYQRVHKPIEVIHSPALRDADQGDESSENVIRILEVSKEKQRADNILHCVIDDKDDFVVTISKPEVLSRNKTLPGKHNVYSQSLILGNASQADSLGEEAKAKNSPDKLIRSASKPVLFLDLVVRPKDMGIGGWLQ